MKTKASHSTASDGQLVVFEGPDDVGKTTLLSALLDRLIHMRINAVRISFPGQAPGTFGRLVYELHHSSGPYDVAGLDPTSLQMLHLAAHIDNISRDILPALRRGQLVLLDRFWWSTLVYGKLAGANTRTLRDLIKIERRHWGRVSPSVLFLISRETTPGGPASGFDRQRLHLEYRRLAAQEQHKHAVIAIANDSTVEAALGEILVNLLRSCPQLVAGDRSGRKEQADRLLPASHPKRDSAQPSVFVRPMSPRPTKVYDTYWRFAAARQEIFFRRFEGCPWPWTDDPILRKYKFTNAYRASDRVSQFLIKDVLYQGDQTPDEIFFRTILFRLFNKIETWQLLQRVLGTPSWSTVKFEELERVLSEALGAGLRIYSAAYIIPAAPFPEPARKHKTHLHLISDMIRGGLPSRLQNAQSLRRAFTELRSYPIMGDFLAYQLTIDLNYSKLLDFSEQEFVVPGPGARDGLRKCFESLGEFSEADAIRYVTERQAEEFQRLGLPFRSLWGRELQLIDCQNLFCEVDKYARVAHPEIRGLTGRERIKQRYRPKSEPIEYWYPPKWGINHLVDGQAQECTL